MLTYQATDTTVNLSFSKEFLSPQELARLMEVLRAKELASKSQMTDSDALALDDELKDIWWQKNKEKFLAKLNEAGYRRYQYRIFGIGQSKLENN